MTLKLLGSLPITEAEYPMLAKSWQQEWGCFTTGYLLPPRFEKFLSEQGLRMSDGNMGLLFSNVGNVLPHTDPFELTALWVLGMSHFEMPPLFLAGGKSVELHREQVYLFDSSQEHAVLADCRTPYLLFCLNVTKMRKKNSTSGEHRGENRGTKATRT